MTGPGPRRLNPRKLLMSKWTATEPQRREKHFLVTRVIEPDAAAAPVEFVEMEAVHSRRSVIVRWRELTDPGTWHQGWR